MSNKAYEMMNLIIAEHINVNEWNSVDFDNSICEITSFCHR